MRLVERAREGDQSAFSDLVDLDGDRCYAVAYRFLRDVEREDILLLLTVLSTMTFHPELADDSS